MTNNRTTSYSEGSKQSIIDFLGFYLSTRKIRKYLGNISGKKSADLGCGYEAKLGIKLLSHAQEIDLFDISINKELFCNNNKITILLGPLEETLFSIKQETYDIVLAHNVIEHIAEKERELILAQIYGILKVGGESVINVPSWRGKVFLEFMAFKLNLSSRLEMNDHKMYFNPKDLWPLLVNAGFLPENITVRTHKFGLNTIAKVVK
jgi:2-polyprenyl-3-methyl-5-hydroxy-6-metoxy-1,4-benzoquinol methylase